MNLYLISQNVNGDYDTYDAAVVAAETREEARRIHPRGNNCRDKSEWADPIYVSVRLLGTAREGTKKGVILASFCAG